VGSLRVITLDAYAASHRAITEPKSAGTMPHRVRIRSSKYLNNVVEQDHRRIKHWIRPMLGFKRFETAAIMISGIELAEKIRKDQFKTESYQADPKRFQRFGRLSWLPDLSASSSRPSAARRQSLHQNHSSFGTIINAPLVISEIQSREPDDVCRLLARHSVGPSAFHR
jgi:hypothetical protein